MAFRRGVICLPWMIVAIAIALTLSALSTAGAQVPGETLRLNPNSDAGLLPERGNCEVYELKDITSQIRH